MSENGEATSSEPLLADHDQCSESGPRQSFLTQERYIPDYWYNIVEQYSRMEWTNALDLFPGLSGIAAFIQQAMHDRYLAGLWQRDLHCGLLWHTGTSRSRSSSSLEELLANLNGDGLHIGPSWSWASRSDFFQFDISPRDNRRCSVRSHLRPEFSLVSAAVTLDGINPLGRVQKSSLKVHSFVIPLRAGCMPVTGVWCQEWYYKTVKGHILSIDLDWDSRSYSRGQRDEVYDVDDGKL